MIGLNFYRSIPTTLKLNGPLLEWTLNPVDASETLAGFATFTGIITSSYPPDSGDVVEGSYEFHWYLGEAEIFDTAIDPNSNVSIDSSGNLTTCTFTNVPFSDNGKIVSVIADYIPATGEANAGNDNLRSSGGTLSAFPEILINNQPTDVIIGSGLEASFNIDAEISPDNGETLFYQWQIDGSDLVNGSQTLTETTEAESATLNVTSDRGDNFTIDFFQVSTFSQFVTGRTYTITSNADITTRVYAIGAGGGTSNVRSVRGGYGGSAQGITTFYSGETYLLKIGGAGVNGASGGQGGFSGGGQGGGGHGLGGGGGGFTGLFVGGINQSAAIIIAGGGGGGSNDPATGGAGGGLNGSRGSNGGRAGGGGTQSGGGSGSGAGKSGSALQGGQGAAGGGGGYFGGGGGQYVGGCCADGAGGGGSGYLSPIYIKEGEFSNTNSAGGGNPTQQGSFKIDRVSVTKQIVVEATGVNTPTLTLTTQDSDFGGVVRCVMNADKVQNSPLISNPVSYEVVDARDIIDFEAYTFNNDYKTSTVNFKETPSYTIDSSTFGTDYSIIQLHSIEKNVPVKMEMFASKGADDGSNVGGEGGVSTIEFTLDRNVEHTLIGISNNSALFLYRGSNLIAVVGEGGNAGNDADGGAGGGINIPGEDGGGRLGGNGGDRINAGTLSLSGSYGSIYQNSGLTLYPGDEVSTAPDGGRTISCTKGEYWIDQGIAACSDNGSSIRFVNVDGTTIGDSKSITRGFKPGYTISNTSGLEINNGGRGGNGATGGQGGTSGAGGGGGSGYSDGSVTVTNAVLGGHTGISNVIISLSNSYEVEWFHTTAVQLGGTPSLQFTNRGNFDTVVTPQNEGFVTNQGPESSKHYLITFAQAFENTNYNIDITVNSPLTAAGRDRGPFSPQIFDKQEGSFRVKFFDPDAAGGFEISHVRDVTVRASTQVIT